MTNHDFFMEHIPNYQINKLFFSRSSYSDRLDKKNVIQKFDTILPQIIECSQELSNSEEFLICESISKVLHQKLNQEIFFPMKVPNLSKSRMIKKYILDETKYILLRTHIFDFNCKKSKEEINNLEEYNKFLKRNGIHVFFESYPGLIYPLMNLFRKTVKNFSKIITSYVHDYKNFNSLNIYEEDKITDLFLNIGDKHNDGQQVALLYFKNKKIIYKPSKGENYQIYHDILNKWNKQVKQKSYSIKIPHIIYKSDHLWMEYISYQPSDSISGMNLFYKKMGIQLSIIYALNGCDFHKENIIAFGNEPCFIDLECLLSWGTLEHQYSNSPLLNGNILDTHLLLNLKSNLTSVQKYSAGIIPTQPVEPLRAPSMKLIHNLDGYLEIKPTSYEIKPDKNIPKYEKKLYFAKNYYQEFEEGFSQGYHFILNNKSQILDNISKRDAQPFIRALLRGSAYYSSLLSMSYHPRFMSNLTDREDFLLKVFENSHDSNLNLEEYISLINDDIPYVAMKYNEDKLYLNGNKINSPVVKATPHQSLLKKIQKISAQDLSNQLKLLRIAIDPPDNLLSKEFKFESNSHSTNSVLFLKVKQIISYMLSNQENLSVTRQKDILEIKPLNNFLYDGKAGIHLLQIYLYKITKEDKYRKSVWHFLRRMNRELKNETKVDIGFFTGYSGIIYLALELYKETQDVHLFSYAKQMIIEVSLTIKENENFEIDIISGVTGLINVSLNLLELKTDEEIRFLSNKLIKFILLKIHTVDKNKEVISWDKNLTGFSHGNSGIIYTLTRYMKIIGDIDVNEVIYAALGYESQHRFGEKWIDLRENSSNDICSWCHGSGGITLTRKLLKDNNYHISDDFDVAIHNLLKNTKNLDNNLCHGQLGNLLILKKVSSLSDISTIENQLLKISSDILNYPDLEKHLKNYWAEQGLMTGLLGVCYSFLSVYDKKHSYDLLLLS